MVVAGDVEEGEEEGRGRTRANTTAWCTHAKRVNAGVILVQSLDRALNERYEYSQIQQVGQDATSFVGPYYLAHDVAINVTRHLSRYCTPRWLLPYSHCTIW